MGLHSGAFAIETETGIAAMEESSTWDQQPGSMSPLRREDVFHENDK
jgi:hypothetical protein